VSRIEEVAIMRVLTHPWAALLALAAGVALLWGDASALGRADIVVTRDPSETPLVGYAEYAARQGQPAPLLVEPIYQSRTQGGKILLLVNATLYPSISTAMTQYWIDLGMGGYSVDAYSVSGGTPASVRAYLQSQSQGLVGVVLIGTLPVPWFEIDYDFDGSDPDTLDNEYACFPCDLFYMDLDGSWADNHTTAPFQAGVYDTHTAGSGDTAPEIWVSRLTAGTLTLGGATEVGLVNNYFAKNHAFREGLLPVAQRALVYVDDDWEASSTETGGQVGAAFPTHLLIDDSYTTCRDDYRDVRLTQGFEWMHVMLHSSYWEHFFKVGGGWEMYGGNYATVTAQDVKTIDPTAIFYNLFACSNCRYVETNYMGGWYIFGQNYGLGAIGTTKTGGMWDFDLFYGPLAQDGCAGSAFRDWLAAQAPYDNVDVRWFYGMTLLGDGALTPRPRLVVADPHPWEVGVPVNQNISLTFDREMSLPSFYSNQFLVHGTQSGRHSGTFSYDAVNRRMTFHPYQEFVDGEVVNVVMAHWVRSREYVPTLPRTWSFTAGISNPTAGVFSSWNTITVSSDVSYELACADFNGDGILDLATPVDHAWTGDLAILLGDASGTFTTSYYSAPDGVRYLACGDFDSDGDTDIAVTAGMSTYPYLSIYRNYGNGTFSGPTNLYSGAYPADVHTGDFDGDGDLDLVTMANPNSSQHYLQLYVNNGSGTFTQTQQYFVRPGCGLRIAAAGDVDNDGDLDLLGFRTGDYGQPDDSLLVFFNGGAGRFGAPVVGPQLPDGPGDLYVNDFDGDGDVDAAAVSVHTNFMTILHNDGDGAMTLIAQHDAGGSNSFCICGGDWDGDGDIDLAQGIGYPDPGCVLVWKNNGNGSFGSAAQYSSPGPYGITYGDIGRDGDLDLVTVRFGAVRTLKNDSGPDVYPPARVADLALRPAGRDTTVTIAWTAPGDDGRLGRASIYRLRYSTTAVGSDTTAWWNAATQVVAMPDPSPAGMRDSCQVAGLASGAVYYALLISGDEVPNWSGYSNVAVISLSASGVADPFAGDGSETTLGSWPNPFTARTDIRYVLPEPGRVRLAVFDPQGRCVATLVDGPQAAGPQRFTWNAPSMPAGVYFFRLETGGAHQKRKIVITR
jgi:hypothetical protein